MLEKFLKIFTNFTDPKYAIMSIVFIAVISIIYYWLLNFLRNNNSKSIIKFFVVLMLLSGIFVVLHDRGVSNLIYLCVPFLFIIFIASIYSVEIKRMIWSNSNAKLGDIKHGDRRFDEEEAQNCITEIIKALQNMSKNDIGAIIILSNGNIPNQVLESGVRLDCEISSELIESIFFPKTPLHDGAMIINGTKIVAAGCFLPLSQRDNLPKDLGSRHRAGIGITETIDVTSLIVSEESGIISTVKAGKITRYADTEVLRNTLSKFYWQEIAGQGARRR